MVDLDSGRKDKWVCPNDRGLALLAKVGAGWSVKTQQYQSYRQQSIPLDESEQQTILEVIQRAEALENLEQERVGRLVDRLDNMKRNAIGSGTNQCILCGAHCILFGMLTTNSILCHDCKKTVCQKCGVETFSGTGPRKEVIWRCKICAETREMWKKSGAWFFKAIPKHVLPVKKPPNESKFHFGSRIGFEKSTWSRTMNMKSSEAEEESSSDDDRASRLLASRSKRIEEPATSSQSQSSLWQVSQADKRSPGTRSIEFALDVKEPISDEKAAPLRPRRGMPLSYRRDTSESSESSGSATTSNLYPMNHTPDSASSRVRCYNGDVDELNYSPSVFSHSRQNSQLSLLTSRDWCSESDHFSLSGSSFSGHKTGVSFSEEISEDFPNLVPDANLGVVELSLFYNSASSSIHVSLHRAKNLKPMDINGLADPFCKLNLLPAGNKSHRLRTRTVHKTCNPEFNETLTFYGVTENDLAIRSIHILVLDDDKYGHDFMGEAKYSLDRLRPDTTRELNLFLEKHYPVENEEVWGEEGWNHGQILITLCYSTRRKALIVGILRCTNLLPMDSNGFSDPFVKLYLHPDHYHRKFKTCVKWKSLNPVFNEEFVFETKITDLSQQSLILTVWDKDYGKSNDYLGCLELGCKSKGERLRQWVDMIKFPDHKHEGWHNLCEDPPPT